MPFIFTYIMCTYIYLFMHVCITYTVTLVNFDSRMKRSWVCFWDVDTINTIFLEIINYQKYLTWFPEWYTLS